MMAAFGRHVDAALQLTAQLILSLPIRGGVREANPFFVYLMTTQEREVIEGFQVALRHHGREQGGEIVTYAEELLAEGEQRGKVEVVEGLVRVGVTWDVIEAATGLTEASFQELKAQLSGPGS